MVSINKGLFARARKAGEVYKMSHIVSSVALVLLLLVLLVLSFRLAMFLYRRAICKVIGVFQRQNAVDARNAKAINELEISLRESPYRLVRDYRPQAFQALAQAGIIQMTQDGRFYLAEDRLASVRGLNCPLAA